MNKYNNDSKTSSPFQVEHHISPSPFQGEGGGEGDYHPRNLSLVPRAKTLRRNMTDVEKKLWHYLRGRRFVKAKFRRQYPLGNYIVDFICIEAMLVIELDGGQHSEQSDYDAKRSAWLNVQGYKVIRFWNHEVIREFDAVMQMIVDVLHERIDYSCSTNPHPNPLPKRERGLDPVEGECL